MTDAAAPHASTTGQVLRIVAGLHAGASRELAEREMILIGSGDDCDIVLADQGVAAHHALISIVDGHAHLRALDAPLRLEGRMLHPGDPVEITRIERIGLGEAALALGHADDPAWLALAPEGTTFEAPQSRQSVPFTRRLPMIAAVAALSLAALAAIALVVPASEAPADPEAQLTALAQEFRVADRRIERGVDGTLVLSGTVHDAASRDAVRARIAADGIDARATLRTGEDLAINVAEILRAGGYPARTRYLGRGDVEVTGQFEDQAGFEAFVRSDAVVGTGVRRIVPINLAASAQGDTGNAAPTAEVRVVAAVRGENAHVVDEHGNQYEVGAQLPGWGQIAVIGEQVHVITADGQMRRVAVRPVTEREQAPGGDDAADDTPAPSAAVQSPAYAAGQARATARRG